MGDALKKLLEKKRHKIKSTARQTIAVSFDDLSNNIQTAKVTSKPLPRRQSQMNHIKQLHKEEVSIRGIT